MYSLIEKPASKCLFYFIAILAMVTGIKFFCLNVLNLVPTVSFLITELMSLTLVHIFYARDNFVLWTTLCEELSYH